MDKVRLGMKAVDELQEDVRDLMATMLRLSIIPNVFEGKEKVQSWIETFGGMTASEELTDDQARQFTHDLEASYNAFNRLLHESNT